MDKEFCKSIGIDLILAGFFSTVAAVFMSLAVTGYRKDNDMSTDLLCLEGAVGVVAMSNVLIFVSNAVGKVCKRLRPAGKQQKQIAPVSTPVIGQIAPGGNPADVPPV
ncbi:unnamed protein product [Linum trigynum]|uniref:Uncharacterized protein n=1 Tax=Linum trigynum TaxID=586398 RepID=A0AAV2FZF0_9ROSI